MSGMLRMKCRFGGPSAGSAAGPKLWRRLSKVLFPPYRPERYYMRGPGPKWHEKHEQSRTARVESR